MAFNLVLIETSGNQQYIFSTNKLRENVGASELTYRVGTQWTLQAVHEQTSGVGGQMLWPDDGDSEKLRQKILNTTLNPAIESTNGLPVEVILATSGKALLLVKDREIGKKIVTAVTTKALETAPGMDVCGVVSEDFDFEKCPLGNMIRRVHELFEETRARIPGPALRFQRLPVVAECVSSGLPAREWHVPSDNDGIDPDARSAVTLAKWDFRNEYKKRMNGILKKNGFDTDKIKFAEDVDTIAKQLEEDTDWIAIIHADGNGLGQIFLDFGKFADCNQSDETKSFKKANRDYVDNVRRFSFALDLCTERAFLNALKPHILNDKWLTRDKKGRLKLPLLPIVLGGDDLTVVCDGRGALTLTRDFLLEFEKETSRKEENLSDDDKPLYKILQVVAKNALGAGRLSSCAGVSVIKSHYPFSGAYEVAEELIRSAKTIKNIVKIINPNDPSKPEVPWPASAIDFHIHYDSSGNDLDRIRRRMITPDGQARLYGRPYVVSAKPRLLDEIEELSEQENAKKWVEQHHWDTLQVRIDEMNKTDQDGRRKLPSSQLHDLRSGLYMGMNAADARYKLIRHRYQSEVNIDFFDGDLEDTLFEERCDWKEGQEEQKYQTKLLDAMDVAALQDRKLAEASKKGDANE